MAAIKIDIVEPITGSQCSWTNAGEVCAWYRLEREELCRFVNQQYSHIVSACWNGDTMDLCPRKIDCDLVREVLLELALAKSEWFKRQILPYVFDYDCWKVEVTNDTKEAYKNVAILYNVSDDDDRVEGYARANIGSVLSGETKKSKGNVVKLTYTDASRIDMSFEATFTVIADRGEEKGCQINKKRVMVWNTHRLCNFEVLNIAVRISGPSSSHVEITADFEYEESLSCRPWLTNLQDIFGPLDGD